MALILSLSMLILFTASSPIREFNPTKHTPPTVAPPNDGANISLIIGLSIFAAAMLVGVIILIICIRKQYNIKKKENDVTGYGELRRLSRMRRNQCNPTLQYQSHAIERLQVDLPGACGEDSAATSCDGDYCMIDDVVGDLHHYDMLPSQSTTTAPTFPLTDDNAYDHIPEPKFKVMVLKPNDNSDKCNTDGTISPFPFHHSGATASAFSPAENVHDRNDAILERNQISENHTKGMDAKIDLPESSATGKRPRSSVIVIENDIYDESKSGEQLSNNGADRNSLIEDYPHQNFETNGNQQSLVERGLSSPGSPQAIVVENDLYEKAADAITPPKVVVAENELYEKTNDLITPVKGDVAENYSYQERAEVTTSDEIAVTEKGLPHEVADVTTPTKVVVAENELYQETVDVIES